MGWQELPCRHRRPAHLFWSGADLAGSQIPQAIMRLTETGSTRPATKIGGATSWNGWREMAVLIIQGREYSVIQEQADEYNALFDEMCERLDALPTPKPRTLGFKSNLDFKSITDECMPRLREIVEDATANCDDKASKQRTPPQRESFPCRVTMVRSALRASECSRFSW